MYLILKTILLYNVYIKLHLTFWYYSTYFFIILLRSDYFRMNIKLKTEIIVSFNYFILIKKLKNIELLTNYKKHT